MHKKIEKKFLVFDKNASELFTVNCLYQEENTFYRQWLCKQKGLRLCMSLRVTLSNSIIFAMINE